MALAFREAAANADIPAIRISSSTSFLSTVDIVGVFICLSLRVEEVAEFSSSFGEMVLLEESIAITTESLLGVLKSFLGSVSMIVVSAKEDTELMVTSFDKGGVEVEVEVEIDDDDDVDTIEEEEEEEESISILSPFGRPAEESIMEFSTGECPSETAILDAGISES